MSWIYVEPDEPEDIDCDALAEGLLRLAESGREAAATIRQAGAEMASAIRAQADARNALGITWNGSEWVQIDAPTTALPE